MARSKRSHVTSTAIDTAAQPDWLRTGYTFFPYAAYYSGQWWVLRLNHGFPEHDLYTVFIDGSPAADISADPDNASPLIAGVASLPALQLRGAEPQLDADAAAAVVQAVSPYVSYGSEHDDPCIFCSEHYDGMIRI
jgi:hypothetical protein